MAPVGLIADKIMASQASPLAQLANPRPSLVGKMLKARLEAEKGVLAPAPLPEGINRDLRPRLPRVAGAALGIYLNHKAVNSYPLIFTTLALAHPN